MVHLVSAGGGEGEDNGKINKKTKKTKGEKLQTSSQHKEGNPLFKLNENNKELETGGKKSYKEAAGMSKSVTEGWFIFR